MLAVCTACPASWVALGGWGTSEEIVDGLVAEEPPGTVLGEALGDRELPDCTEEAEPEKEFGIDVDWEAGIEFEERSRTF